MLLLYVLLVLLWLRGSELLRTDHWIDDSDDDSDDDDAITAESDSEAFHSQEEEEGDAW
jgi:hypothetical protein